MMMQDYFSKMLVYWVPYVIRKYKKQEKHARTLSLFIKTDRGNVPVQAPVRVCTIVVMASCSKLHVALYAVRCLFFRPVGDGLGRL